MRLADLFERVLGSAPGVRFSAYDGSRAGADEASAQVTIELRTPRGLSYLATSPSDLGIGRAYVAGDLEVHGDMYTAMKLVSEAQFGSLPWRDRWELIKGYGPDVVKHFARPPAQEVRLRGRRHSKQRDGEAVSHHYDISNRFYELVLGPSMTYTCAVYPHPDATLEQAQEEKYDLVCRKLGLQPGMRLLDVGCGWGGMVMHAAQHYGVQALGATLSRQQAEWASKAIADAGLEGRAEVRFSDYRDVPEAEFDAVSSIGLTEHIGRGNLGPYFASLRAKLRPQGRLLNHCITRPRNDQPVLKRHGFINRYVFPDGELEGAATIGRAMQDCGLELRHEENLREHYAMTLRDWGTNLERNWDDCVREVGVGRARVWRVYMAGSRLSFEQGSIELHQILGVRTEGGQAAMPLRPDWERAASELPVRHRQLGQVVTS